MNAKRLLTLSVVAASFAAAAVSVSAADPAVSSRALVRAEFLQARNDRTLVGAGEASQPIATALAGEARSRADVRAEVMQARRDDELAPAGQGMATEVPFTSMLARAEVRESVREASMRGELIPAGEGVGPAHRTARVVGPRRDAYAANARR